MRLGWLLLALAWLAAGKGLALENNQPQSWPSPDGHSLIRETFSGEGKRVVPLFVNLATGHQSDFLRGDSRNLEALWSPDGHFVAVNADRSHRFGQTRLYRVRDGRISEISLPEGMEARHFLSPGAGGAVFYESMQTKRWTSSNELEIESSTEAEASSDRHIEDVAHGFIVRIEHDEAKTVRSFAVKTGP